MNVNCLPGNGRHLGGSKDQVHLAPDPDRLEGTSHPPHLVRRAHLVLLQERRVFLVVANRWRGSQDAFRPLARQTVDELGEVLAHAHPR